MTPLEIYNKHFKDWNESIFPASIHFEKAMIEYSDQQCLERDERIKKLEEALSIIGKISDHGIPYYAIGDSEAADTLNSLLQQVLLIVGQALFSESKP